MPYLGHMSTQTEVGTIPQFTIHDRLRKARETTGLDQATFASELGVSRNTVSNYETGGIDHPRKIVLGAWAMRTGVPLEWLQTGENPQQDGPDGGLVLPRLDSNQQPSGSLYAQVIEGPWGALSA